MGIAGVLTAIAFNMVLLWLTIKFVTGNTNHEWREMFMWALFITLISALKYPMMIFSNSSFFMLIVGIVNVAIVGALVYFLIGFRLGILDPRPKLKIVGIFIGVRMLLGFVVRVL